MTAALFLFATIAAESRPSRYHYQPVAFCESRYCGGGWDSDWRWHHAKPGKYRGKSKYRHDARTKRYAKTSATRHWRSSGRVRSVRAAAPQKKARIRVVGWVVAHPPGCPSRAFCGCGVSMYVFGERVRSLYLAANWLKFPKAEPAPGMVAARRGHVFAIITNLGGGKVLAYDPNSGRRQTRIHVRSLAGFRVVNPHGEKT